MLKRYLNSNNFKKICKLETQSCFSHCILLNSPDDISNKQLSLILSLKLICSNNLCFSCPNCLKVKENTHPDVLIYPEKDNFLVEDAVSIISKVYVKPMLANCKVFIINNFDKSTLQAQNKLLKILEEPPQNVYFLINATQTDKILPTIMSRCQKISLLPFSKSEMEEIIGSSISDDAFALSDGWINKALDIKSNSDYIKIYYLALDIICKMKSSKEILAYSISMSKDKKTFDICIKCLNEIYRDMLMLLCNKKAYMKHNIVELENVVSNYTSTAVIEIIKMLSNAKRQSELNVLPSMLADNLLISILEVKHKCK